MKSFTANLVLAIVLVLAGFALWSAGNREQRLAAAERTLVTLRFDRAAQELGDAAVTDRLNRILPDVVTGGNAARERLNLSQYWLGDFETIVSSEDPALKRLGADAAFRAARREGGSPQQLAAHLDSAAKRYADELRTNPTDLDAAYNYEFAVRLRTAVLATKQKIAPGDPPASELTIHGYAGGPPQDSDMKKFRMIIPMRPEERMEAEEAGRAQTKIRKG
jgi:hypothetical protein